MEKMSAQPQRSPSTVPLARDPDGNFIELPEGAVGWRIRRQTGGRPRLLLDSRKQPMLFPLDYTIADVEDILSPGSYLLDAVDKSGELLGVTVAVSIGMPRNADSGESDNDHGDSAPVVVPTALPYTTSDVRLVLEANVRATQMAFIHNQRTLETGLRMAETLRDSVQVLASSQADWIKSLSSARGFFRSTGQPMPPVEVKQLTVNTGGDDGEVDDDDDDGFEDRRRGGGDGDGGAPSPAHWSEPFLPIITQLAMQVMPAISAWSAKQMAEGRSRRGGKSDDAAAEAARAEEQRAAHAEQEEQQRAAQPGREHAEKLAAAIAAASSPGPGINVIKLLQLLPQRTATKLMQIQMALSPEDQADARQILVGYGADALEELLTVFDAASLDECTTFLRNLIAEWHRMQAARQERAKAPRPDDDGTGGASGMGGASGPGSVRGPGGASGMSGASAMGGPTDRNRARAGEASSDVSGVSGFRGTKRTIAAGHTVGGGAAGSGATAGGGRPTRASSGSGTSGGSSASSAAGASGPSGAGGLLSTSPIHRALGADGGSGARGPGGASGTGGTSRALGPVDRDASGGGALGVGGDTDAGGGGGSDG